MLSRAMVHAVFVALVVVLAVEGPDVERRSDPPWLAEVCDEFADFAQACAPDAADPGGRAKLP